MYLAIERVQRMPQFPRRRLVHQSILEAKRRLYEKQLSAEDDAEAET